jgi:thiamine pyrophosphokinase
VLGADGGSRHARTLNVSLDAVIGDMDSLSDLERQAIGKAEIISYPREKDESDLELALLYARKQGADHIVIVGAMGGRMETAVANILAMASASLTSCRIELWHGEQTGWLMRPPGGTIPGEPGDTVSLIPLGGAALGITTTAMKYPLRNEDLPFGSSRGMSNVVEGTANVRLSKGLLLAVHTAAKGEEKEAMPKRTINVSVQCLPIVDDLYGVVDKAIEVIKGSGLKYEVGPMETTIEGDNLDRLLDVAKAAHRACFEAGAQKVVTIVKIGDAVEGMTMCGKVEKHRKSGA